MKIGLIDVDGHSDFPNLALMKLSAWHKARGDTVEWWWGHEKSYDRVYMSKVFSAEYTPDVLEPSNAREIIKGGTGYAITLENGREVYHRALDKPLPPEVEHSFPDYSLYYPIWDAAIAEPKKRAEKISTAYGFLTRGCPRGCPFCHVAGKEGRASRKAADLSEFWNGQKNIEIMDPNILACREREDLLYQLRRSRAKVNFNQGLDIRLIDRDVSQLLMKIRHKQYHFAWDNPQDDLEPCFRRFAGWFQNKNKGMVYVLCNFGSTMEENLHRIYTLRDLGYDPFVMVYDKPNAPEEICHLQRWCNKKWIFKEVEKFYDYEPMKKGCHQDVYIAL